MEQEQAVEFKATAALIAAIVAEEVVCEASCEWDPGVVLTLLIPRFRLSAAVGLWACGQCLFALSTNPRAYARGDLRPAQLALARGNNLPDWRGRLGARPIQLMLSPFEAF